MTTILFPFIGAAIDAAFTAFDITLTERGLKAGVAVEANEIVDAVDHTNKPGSLFLYAWDLGFIGVVLTAATLMIAKGSANTAAVGVGAGTIVLLVDAVKHLKGGLDWRYMLAGGKIDPNEANTFWQKFLGVWHWHLPKK